MVGKGSIQHNNRKYSTKNVDKTRTGRNTVFVNDNLKGVYHELFDEAVEEYNKRQKREDRRIRNYYDKIENGKQEKLFHEIILQIGNRDDTHACSEEGKLAEQILKEYMSEFEERNPYLRVFNAVIHMDEETPHLHIDYVPFTTESKNRGPNTRVSFKQAMAQQGFCGGSRKETEWKQWADSEKEHLASIMRKYDVEWLQLGTHEKHLSVYDYKKQERIKEVEKLDGRISDIRYNVKKERLEKARLKIQNNSRARENEELLEHNVKLEGENVELMEHKVTLTDKNEELQEQQESLKHQCYQLEQEYEAKQAYLENELKKQVVQMEEEVEDWGKTTRYVSSLEDTYENGREWNLDEPSGFITARTYKEKMVDPLVRKLKEVVVNFARKCSWLEKQLQKKEYENHQLSNLVSQHKDDKQYWEYLTKDMRVKADKYDVLERGMGMEQIEHVMKVVGEPERGWR